MANEWLEDKAWYKVMNMESPGSIVEISYNALPTFQYQDGAVALMPKVIADALNRTILTKYEVVGKIGEENRINITERPRYMAILDNSKSKEIQEDEGKKDVSNSMKKSFKKSLEEEDEE